SDSAATVHRARRIESTAPPALRLRPRRADRHEVASSLALPPRLYSACRDSTCFDPPQRAKENLRTREELFVRPHPPDPIATGQHKLLNPFAGPNLTRIEIAERVQRNCVDPKELSGHPPEIPNRAHDLPGLSIVDPNLVVRAIRNEDVFLPRIVRERQVVRGSAHAQRCVARPAAFRTMGRR